MEIVSWPYINVTSLQPIYTIEMWSKGPAPYFLSLSFVLLEETEKLLFRTWGP